MHRTYIFPCIMTMISNFTIFFIFQIFAFQIFLHKYFRMIPAALLLITAFSFFKKVIVFIACSIKNLQVFFHTTFYLCIHHAYLHHALYTSWKNRIEYVHLLLLIMNFQDYFYINQSFLLYILDLHE